MNLDSQCGLEARQTSKIFISDKKSAKVSGLAIQERKNLSNSWHRAHVDRNPLQSSQSAKYTAQTHKHGPILHELIYTTN